MRSGEILQVNLLTILIYLLLVLWRHSFGLYYLLFLEHFLFELLLVFALYRLCLLRCFPFELQDYLLLSLFLTIVELHLIHVFFLKLSELSSCYRIRYPLLITADNKVINKRKYIEVSKE